eukprot:GCRY01001894.1.p1 GENE.GCRY01001894.1~~GCRY01001894.1.p1  ORF type:complete len:657 (+),score=176.62 GCRY01001894.1:169-2139(+)
MEAYDRSRTYCNDEYPVPNAKQEEWLHSLFPSSEESKNFMESLSLIECLFANRFEKSTNVLHQCIKQGHHYILGVLLELAKKRSNFASIINQGDEDHNTPAHYCALHNMLVCARLVRASGADLSLKNKEEMTPSCVGYNLAFIQVADELATRTKSDWTVPSPLTAVHEPGRPGDVVEMTEITPSVPAVVFTFTRASFDWSFEGTVELAFREFDQTAVQNWPLTEEWECPELEAPVGEEMAVFKQPLTVTLYTPQKTVIGSCEFSNLTETYYRAGDLRCHVLSADGTILGNIFIEYYIATTYTPPCLPHPLPPRITHPLFVGHRGSGSDFAWKTHDTKWVDTHRFPQSAKHLRENTLLALKRGHDMGTEMCEFDVIITKCGTPVIHHDYCIPDDSQEEVPGGGKRLVSEEGRKQCPWVGMEVRDLTLAQCKEYADTKIFEREGVFTDAPLPTVEEALTLLPPSLGLNIEIRYPLPQWVWAAGTPVEMNFLVDNVLDVVFKHTKDRHVVISSFHPQVAALCARKQSHFPVYFLTCSGLYEKEWAYRDEEKLCYIDPRSKNYKEAVRVAERFAMNGVVTHTLPVVGAPELVEMTKRRNLTVLSWGLHNNDHEDIRRQLMGSIDGVIGDYIEYMDDYFTHKKEKSWEEFETELKTRQHEE